MSDTTGLLVAAALLLGAAGVGKAVRPGPAALALLRARIPGRAVRARPAAVRGYGVAEVLVCVMVLAVGGRVAAAAVAIGYGVLVAVAARVATTAPGAACGCFGTASDRVGSAHLAVTLGGVVVGLLGLVRPADPLSAVVAANPAAGGLTAAAALVLALTAYATLAALPTLTGARAALRASAGRS